MTVKNVRIENADRADARGVLVTPQHMNDKGEWEDAPEVAAHFLPHPTDQAVSYVHERRRLIIQLG